MGISIVNSQFFAVCSPRLGVSQYGLLHFGQTYGSWLNLVERFFSELTTRQLRRLAVTSVDDLIAAIAHYIEHRNKHPKPFVWTATVERILTKVDKANVTLAALHQNGAAR